jgi:RNA polymerase sigma factor (sigma-70 family)
VNNDTDLGGAAASFPPTRCSVVRATADADPAVRKEAQQTLIGAYWKPVYKYIRVRWHMPNEDAKDLTQAFFARAMEKTFFDRFDARKARFRTFLRLCVDGFVSNEQRAAGRLKRGGETEFVAFDFAAADLELGRQPTAPETDADAYFRHEWLRDLFAFAVDGLRRHCTEAGKDVHFRLFLRYDVEAAETAEPLSYARLAEDFGLTTSQVTNYLAFARSHFRFLVLQRLRATTGSEEEYQLELRTLFGGPSA